MPHWPQNPKVLFWIALVLILVNCSMLTVTRTVFGGNPNAFSLFMDFTPVFAFLLAFWLFKNLAASVVN
jgi:hypothetical protein